MRIASASILIAVLSLAAVVRASPWSEGSESSSLRHSRHAAHRQQESWQDDWTSPRRMQALLRREGGEEGRSVDCCPSVMEMVQPKGGRNQEGMYVELYVGNNPYNETQRFYEFSCREDVVDQPCRFVDRKLRNQSRCEQKYAFQYAIVRADDPPSSSSSSGGGGGSAAHTFFPNGTSGWKLDYILVRSGCSCVVMPPKTHSRKKAAGGGRRYKSQGGSRERTSSSSSSGAGILMGAALPSSRLRVDALDDDNT